MLGESLGEFVQSQVETGSYGSASEVIQAGLKLLEKHEMKVQQLRAEIKKVSIAV